MSQTQDYTALCVLGLGAEYLKVMSSRDVGYDRLEKAHRNLYLDVDLRVMRRELDTARKQAQTQQEPEPIYEVRHL